MTRARRTQRRTDGHRKNTRDQVYRPHGALPWPELKDGTMYRPEMRVVLVRVDEAEDLDLEWEGRLLWVTYTEDEVYVPLNAKKHAPERGRWKATVDWGPGGRPPGSVWLDELEPAP